MTKKLFVALAGLWMSSAVLAQTLRPLDDADLAQVSARDGVSFAVHLVLNDPAGGAGSRLSWGTTVGGITTYLVVDNRHGVIDMAGLQLDIAKKPDGSDYVAMSLPFYMKYTNFEIGAVSLQADPLVLAAGGDLGRFNLNGTQSMQGQFRFWAH